MLIMRNSNRLIDDFKKQTRSTIWKHLNAMAVNYAVYSTHLNSLPPFLTDYEIYLYCNLTNVVVVCLDCCGHNEKNIYNESETLGSLILADGEEPRVSTVWKISKAVELIKTTLQGCNPDINVYGVLLTEAEILNKYLLEEQWEDQHVMVIDDLSRLRNRSVQVNVDEDLACKDYIQTIIDTTIDESTAEMPLTKASNDETGEDESWDSFEEFEKLLDQFIREGMEEDDEDELSDHDGEDDNLPDDDDEINLDDFPEGSVHTVDDDTDDEPSVDDELFPDGEIEQNQNISVKVDILRPIANPREELDKLVGCTDIKRRIDELLSLTSFNKMMREVYPNRKRHEVSLHSIFLGRPGTGKTTVCKIFGSLLRQAGALSKGHVVVCDRGTFIGTLWGDEERSMRQVLEMAKGGVLMIDEAYLLNGKHENDPGKLVVQLLMTILADETQRDIAVVLCGYKKPMQKMLESNPGLQSRFPNKFEFTDFTVDDLLEITRRRVKDYEYEFTDEAWTKYADMLTQVYQAREPESWGNARFVANLLERIYVQHAVRCVKQQPQDKRGLLLITPEDIPAVEMPRPKTKIGF